MLKSYKYCLSPTEPQKEWFEGLFRACKFVYNLALETKITAWRSGKITLPPYALMKQLTELKNTDAQWLKEYPSQCLESSITNMGKAYDRFFKGGGFPKFKSRFNKQTVTFRAASSVENNSIRLSRIGFVEFIHHRKLPDGDIRSVVVSKESTGKYFVSILINDSNEIPEKQPITTESAIGIDMGLKTFATLSDGQKIDNPKYLHEQLHRLRIEQRKLSRRFKKGVKEQSKGYQKQKLVVAMLHEKIANKRKDFLHKLSSDIISNNDTLVIETLNISGMQKTSMARSIKDVSWYEFSRMLEYKAEWSGKNIIKIGMFEPSSKMCSNCGAKNTELKLFDREWDCQNCGAHHDRDINAAINIKNIGLKTQPSTANVDR